MAACFSQSSSNWRSAEGTVWYCWNLARFIVVRSGAGPPEAVQGGVTGFIGGGETEAGAAMSRYPPRTDLTHRQKRDAV
jgi:hypothetical protein